MIKSLDIQNYALIEFLHMEFDKGLNIVTGETGAGKSIMLDAMSLIMGKRADTKVLFDASKKCIVEAKFDIKNLKLQSFFIANDFDYTDELIIRREISNTGKSRAFINDTPATLEIVSELTDQLIDLHQQFDTLDLHKPAFQMAVIDALAKNDALLSQYQNLFKAYKNNLKLLNDSIHKANANKKEIDFLKFQQKEFDDINIKLNEKEELEASMDLLTNAEDIKRITGEVAAQLTESEQSMYDRLLDLNRELQHISSFDKNLLSIHERLSSLVEEVKDLGKETLFIHEDTEYDQKAINEIQERLNAIYKLEKKHGVIGSKALLEAADEIKRKLYNANNLDSNIETLQSEIEKQKLDVTEIAKQLSKNRSAVLQSFTNEVEQKIRPLGMENAKMEVKMRMVDLDLYGMDHISFYFAANKGSELKPMKEVASGGEMSRLTLVIKSIITEAISLPTMIFDEIDTGISGEVARKMAAILNGLSLKHQVVCITHSPQIASTAHKHYFVFKEDKGNRTASSIKILKKEERIIEIAKMLSGDPPSKTALENAKEMIEG